MSLTGAVPDPRWRRPPRASRTARAVRVPWLSGRALLLHLTLVVAFPVCLLAGWWQLERALSGNPLSFVYVFEWPAFAGLAVWSWWALLTAPARSGDGPPSGLSPESPDLLAKRCVALRWDPDAESTRLKAYNAHLAELARHPSGCRSARATRRRSGGRRA